MNDWAKAPVFGVKDDAALYTVRPSAYGLLKDGLGRIATVRTPEGVYLPGGGIEAGETPAQTIAREAIEECGLVLRVGRWETRAVQFAYSRSERTHFEKRCTFLEAVVEEARPSGTEPDHELLWVSPEAVRGTLAHESHEWAIAIWRHRSKAWLGDGTGMEARLEAAGPNDSDVLVDLMRDFYAGEHLHFDEQEASRALREILSDASRGLVFLVRVGESLAGYVVVTFGFSLEFHGRDAFVDEIYLRESFRGRGFGRASLRFVEEMCGRQGIRALHLEVERANARAQKVYRQAGFRDHDRYLLTKWLSQD